MGMESFFVIILPKEVVPIKKDGLNSYQGHVPLSIFDFTQMLSKKMEFIKCDQNQIIIDDAIKIIVGTEESFIREITLEGCFAWYIDGLKLCYTIIRNINEILGTIKVYHPSGLIFELLTEADFIQNVTSIYETKYQSFINQFGSINYKVLPDQPFYKVYEKNKRKGIWSKLFLTK